MKRVAIIGHFGFGLDLANGQTIKTKIVTEAVSNAVNGDIYTVDAHGGIKAVLPVIGGCVKSLMTCRNVIVMLTENGLRVSIPVLAICNRLFHRSLHYVVIGGWLPEFLKKKKSLLNHLKCFDYIYVETNTMLNALGEMGLKNVVVMPNCKNLHILDKDELIYSIEEPFKLCTFSRVMKEKGIEDAIDAVKTVNDRLKRVVYKLDIYGQVDEQQKDWFDEQQKEFPEYIRYGGVIPYDKSVEVLKNYFALLFPTRFYTEGIPGTVIDAYAAGIPVISSRWESFSDVIDDGVTGIGYEFSSLENLVELLTNIASDPSRVETLKQNCIEKAEDYTIDSAMKILCGGGIVKD
jgi:glycosyltransferase involved in cell wall biosynthesis